MDALDDSTTALRQKDIHTMSDDTVTSWRTKAIAAWAFARGHWDWCGPLAGLALGWLIGKVL